MISQNRNIGLYWKHQQPPLQQFCCVIEFSWIDMLFCIIPYQNHIYTGRICCWADISAGVVQLQATWDIFQLPRKTASEPDMSHAGKGFTPLPMLSQDHNLLVYLWFWFTTTKNNWFFKEFWSEGKIACQGVLVALMSKECWWRYQATSLSFTFGLFKSFCISEFQKPTHVSSHGDTRPYRPYQQSTGEVPFIWL